jgi:hypothetical protein
MGCQFRVAAKVHACIAGISKLTATTMLGWHRLRPKMQYESMLIYPCWRLRTEVVIGAFEVEGCDAMLAEDESEGCAAIHRLGREMSHIVNRSLSKYQNLGAIDTQP